MPHRDLACPNPHDTAAQDLVGLIRRAVGPVDFAGCRFGPLNAFTPFGLTAAALLWAWSDRPGLLARCDDAVALATRLFPGAAGRVSYQAFMKQLVRHTDRLVGPLSVALRTRMRDELPGRFRVGKFALFGVDGTKLDLPRTRSHERPGWHWPSASARLTAPRCAGRPGQVALCRVSGSVSGHHTTR
ncbi:MAG: hypothetical protein AAF532_02125 [Planctomycetota bacterium]